MVAFEVFGWPVYWYGIFYLITFVCWYILLSRVVRTPSLQYLKNDHKPLYTLLHSHLDDVFILLMLGVIVWWRLWHVIFYDWWYYSNHLLEIIQINQWWMSFVWGILGVMIWLLYIKQKYSLSRSDFLLFWDFILLVVPLWSLLWRIGNYLNQELIGRPIDELPVYIWDVIQRMWLDTTYTARDTVVRVNINYIQSIFEWWVLLVLTWIILVFVYMNAEVKTQVGTIAWYYFIWYGVIRFCMEFFKDLPTNEMYGIFSVSQLLSFLLVILWIYVLMRRR